MEELVTIVTVLIASGGIIAGLGWKVLTQGIEVKTGNKILDAIVEAGQKEAIATDCYIRSMADGTLTIEEGEEFKQKAADAIISHLTAIEEITGKQIYNRSVVPLPLPVGGVRKEPEVKTETPTVSSVASGPSSGSYVIKSTDPVTVATEEQTEEQPVQSVGQPG